MVTMVTLSWLRNLAKTQLAALGFELESLCVHLFCDTDSLCVTQRCWCDLGQVPSLLRLCQSTWLNSEVFCCFSFSNIWLRLERDDSYPINSFEETSSKWEKLSLSSH